MSDKRSKRKAYRRKSNNNKKILLGFVLLIIIVVIGAYFFLNNPSIYTLDISVEGSGNIIKNPDRDHYNNNEEISLTAAASEGWLFGGWSGDFTGLSNTINIVLDRNKTVTATFVEQTEPVKVLLTTNRGDILIELRNDMPITTGNFISLVRQGIYNNTIFHRVISDFMIQGGDPTGTGFGDPSIPNIPDEFTENNKNNRGTIAMANAGPNTGSSQFFINVFNNNHLDAQHPVFGVVIEGMNVVDEISLVPTNNDDRPIEDITIIKAELIIE